MIVKFRHFVEKKSLFRFFRTKLRIFVLFMDKVVLSDVAFQHIFVESRRSFYKCKRSFHNLNLNYRDATNQPFSLFPKNDYPITISS